MKRKVFILVIVIAICSLNLAVGAGEICPLCENNSVDDYCSPYLATATAAGIHWIVLDANGEDALCWYEKYHNENYYECGNPGCSYYDYDSSHVHSSTNHVYRDDGCTKLDSLQPPCITY